ncbi:DRG1, partial [Symbiodinium pilosum]
HAEGGEHSETRVEYEEECFNQCEEVLAEFETFSRKELDRLKDDPRRKVLPEEVKEKLKEMREEASFKLKRADDLDAMAMRTGGYNNMSSTLRRQSRELTQEADSFQRLELRKAADRLPPQVCDICGSGYLGDEEYNAHLNFRVHEGYQQVREKYEELQKKRAQRQRKSKAQATSPAPSARQDGKHRAADNSTDLRRSVAKGQRSVRSRERAPVDFKPKKDAQEDRNHDGDFVQINGVEGTAKKSKRARSRRSRTERERRRGGRRRRQDYVSEFDDYTEYEADEYDDDYEFDRDEGHERNHRRSRHRRQRSYEDRGYDRSRPKKHHRHRRHYR